MEHKAGFINIIGNPNVGKSTIMNKLVGENLSIITSKSQTTRHRIMGIVNGEDYQMVYSDTPGILKPNYKLQQSMMRFVNSALSDADILIYVTDVVEKIEKNEEYLKKIKDIDIPILLLINKIDISDQDNLTTLVETWHKILPKAEIVPLSAIEGFNLKNIFARLLELLPENPAYFPKDELTDKPMRFFVSEIVREKILLNYQKEIPYSVEVEVTSYKQEKKITKIAATIFCARDSQKGIIIGHQGKSLKKTGTMARLDIQDFIKQKVFLDLSVKVKKDWRNDDKVLNSFGY